MKVFTLVLIFFCSYASVHASGPDWDQTPGEICQPKDRDFEKYDYPEQIARCKRHVTKSEKKKVADSYGGIPEDDWRNYEFDHLIPLCAGGSNAIENIWPEPIDHAHEKDKVENQVCRGMKAGTMTQKKAIQTIMDYFSHRYTIL